MNKKNKGLIFLLIGVSLVIFPAVIATLTLFGLVEPIIFPPTGKPLDLMPFINVLGWFLMLLIILYTGSRIVDWSIKYLRSD
ncbi:MAG: hypothetical protein ACTSQO_08110 [Candidatus Helarchaeota archaeon]